MSFFARTFEHLRQWSKTIRTHTLTLWFAQRHPQTPLHAKVFCVLILAYALSPIDLIPDFIPILGFLDEMILLPCALWISVAIAIPWQAIQ